MSTTLTKVLNEGRRHGRDDCTWKEVGYSADDRQAPDASMFHVEHERLNCFLQLERVTEPLTHYWGDCEAS